MLKNEYGLAPLRVRGLDRVALHADLTMLAQLSQALARARALHSQRRRTQYTQEAGPAADSVCLKLLALRA